MSCPQAQRPPERLPRASSNHVFGEGSFHKWVFRAHRTLKQSRKSQRVLLCLHEVRWFLYCFDCVCCCRTVRAWLAAVWEWEFVGDAEM